ncbi:MAG: ferrochelatase [Rhodothermales bacterium]
MPRTGLIMLNFGEPAEPTPEAVIPFLERIFYTNAPLEQYPDEAALRRRCRELAERRAPGLIADYQAIGGSPLDEQANRQTERIQDVLAARGHDVRAYLGMQYTGPTIAEAVQRAIAEGADQLIGFSVYPLCGFTTNVAALNDVWSAAAEAGFEGPIRGISGWHAHPGYTAMRADHIAGSAAAAGIDLHAPDTLLYFSAHGTPMKYIEAGSRYDRYVEEQCRQIAERLAVQYTIGYQNHANRNIAWTQPDNETHLHEVDARQLVVEPISFLHEQSETLAELDIDFKEKVEAAGIAFFRVPVPHDDARLIDAMADLVESLLDADAPALYPCRCRPDAGTFCTNGGRTLHR